MIKVDITKTKAYQTMPTVASSDSQWLDWLHYINSRYGNDTARKIFLALWLKRGSSKANTIELRKQLKEKYNIEIDESVWNKIADVGGSISDTFGGIFKAGKIVTLVVGGVIVLALFNVVRNVASGNVSVGGAKIGGARK